MYELESVSILLGEKEFAGYKNTEINQYYFAERVAQFGVLDFGYIEAGQSKKISLAANNISSPILVDSIVVTAPGTTGDEVEFKIYRNGQPIAHQKFSNIEMPLNHPSLILTPDLEIEVIPKYDSAVFIYVKPVDILFRATPTV